MDRLLDRLETELVGSAVGRSPLHAAAGHPDAEAVVVVIAPRDLLDVGARLGQLHRRRPPELAPPEHERALEEPQGDKIVEERADRLIALLRQPCVIPANRVVAVPRLPLAMPHLDVAHAALDEPAGDEHLPPLGVVTVAVADMLWLAGDVESLPRF